MSKDVSSLSSQGKPSRRQALAAVLGGAALAAGGMVPRVAQGGNRDPKWEAATETGLAWLAKRQTKGGWHADRHPIAISGLAAIALVASGSTTTQGPYAKNICQAVDYLLGHQRPNGLIGDPVRDNHYTYGHGFAMLFLSQILGEEDDEDRRAQLLEALQQAVDFSGKAQTSAGGWGYVAAKAINDFDEGSTTITQVQGLRGCRNAGITVPSDVIEKAKKYIYDCKNGDGGISYSSRNKGTSRPAITAAALATLNNAGDYDSEHVPKMLEYAKTNLHDLQDNGSLFGHWHYAFLYYSQVVYRQGEQEWLPFRNRLYDRITREQKMEPGNRTGYWEGGPNVGAYGPVYLTACNLIMLQLDKAFLPIYQR